MIHTVAQGELYVSHSKLARGGSFSVTALPHVEWWVALAFALIMIAPSIVGFAYFIRQRLTNNDWYYAPVKESKVPQNLLVNQSDQIMLDGRLYPRYITQDYEAQPYWLEDVENTSMEELSRRVMEESRLALGNR